MKNCRKNQLFIIFFELLLVMIFFVACASHPQIEADLEAYLYPAESFLPEKIEWQEVEPGIARLDFENPEFPLIYHLVRIELNEPGLELVCYPDEKTRFSGATFKGQKTSDFSQKNSCTVAVNASPFNGSRFGKKRSLAGVHIVKGAMLSHPCEKYAALLFNWDNVEERSAQIIHNQDSQLLENCTYAFGAFFSVLKDGELVDFKVRSHNSRTGAGLSKDGKILYLLVVEGEKPDKSEGMSYPQCGQVFKALGCENALEFDGGSSSQLFINGKNALNYSTIVVQGNSFGFRIKK